MMVVGAALVPIGCFVAIRRCRSAPRNVPAKQETTPMPINPTMTDVLVDHELARSLWACEADADEGVNDLAFRLGLVNGSERMNNLPPLLKP